MSTLPGANILLEGPAGTGKTYSLGTLVDAGIETFYLNLESGMESLLGFWTDRGKPIPPNLRWHHLRPATASFAQLIDGATKVNTLSHKSLAEMSDPDRMKHNQFIELLKVLNDFTDQRSGTKFGPVDTWLPTRAIVVDGLTGVNSCAMSLVVGAKPVRSQSDWGIAQDQVEKLLRMLCDQCRCHFILIAHVEREVDQVLGGSKITVSTLGKALAPKIPAMFSDVILATRQGDKFLWDTSNAQADLKTRNLAIAGNLEPSFGPIIAKWKSRGEAK